MEGRLPCVSVVAFRGWPGLYSQSVTGIGVTPDPFQRQPVQSVFASLVIFSLHTPTTIDKQWIYF